MRELVDIKVIENSKDIFSWFLMNGFPEGLDEENDMALVEIIEEEFIIDTKTVDEFTGYYDGIFDDNDGYVESPKAVEIVLNDSRRLYIDFHPGVIEYYIESNKLGELGPHYDIHKLSYGQYKDLLRDCSPIEKIMLLPMIFITQDDVEDVISLVAEFLPNYEINGDICNRIYSCIISNCLDE